MKMPSLAQLAHGLWPRRSEAAYVSLFVGPVGGARSHKRTFSWLRVGLGFGKLLLHFGKSITAAVTCFTWLRRCRIENFREVIGAFGGTDPLTRSFQGGIGLKTLGQNVAGRKNESSTRGGLATFLVKAAAAGARCQMRPGNDRHPRRYRPALPRLVTHCSTREIHWFHLQKKPPFACSTFRRPERGVGDRAPVEYDPRPTRSGLRLE